jgi:hypothetical protein
VGAADADEELRLEERRPCAWATIERTVRARATRRRRRAAEKDEKRFEREF